MKKQVMLFGIVALLVCIEFSGCQQETAPNNEYRNTKYGYGFTPTTEWKFDAANSTDDNVIFHIGTTRSVNFLKPFNLSVSMEWVRRTVVYNYSNFYTNFSLLSTNETIINGMDVYWLLFYGCSSADNPTFSCVVGKDFLIEKNGLVYQIRFRCPATDFKEEDSIVEQGISTFTVEG
jgi:hypothetical protein